MRRRLVAALVVLGGLGAAQLAPTAAPTPPPAEYRFVSSTVLVCPRTTSAGQSTNVLGAMVAGPTFEQGSAVLRATGSSEDLVQVASPDDPVVLRLAGQPQPQVLMQATGSWAPSSFAGIVSGQLTGVGAGLSSASCPESAPDWWFVGAGSQIGRGAALLVTNAAQEPARFDINLYSGAGPTPALAGKGIDLGPGASVRLRADALAPDEDLLAINVRATSGRVTAAVRDVAVPRDGRARGVDFIPAAQQPGTRLVVAGIPGGEGRRDLVLVNPGTQFATVSPRLLTEDGPTELPDLAAIAVPAGSVIQVDLARVLGGEAGTLDLTSDVPITGGARLEFGAATRDVSWLAAVPLIGGPDPLGGSGAVPTGPGLSTSVVVAAPEGEVRGTLTTTTMGSTTLAALTGSAPEGDGDTSGPGAQVVLPEAAVRSSTQDITVPSGSQRTIELDAGQAQGTGTGLELLTWRSEADTGPAAVTHLVLDPDQPLATGYPWWPVRSSVLAVEVREDMGVLAPAR